MRKVTLIASVSFVAFSAHAMAQAVMVAPAPSGPSINGQPIIQAIESIVSDVGPYVVAAVVAWIGKLVHNNMLKVALQKAFEGGAKGVYEALVAQGATVTNIPIKNAAIASEVNTITANYKYSMKALGVTPDTVHNAIRKEVGGLLAVDPTVTVTPATTAAPAPKLITDDSATVVKNA